MLKETVMPVYNLIEFSDNYSKTCASLWTMLKNDAIADFLPHDSNSALFKFKTKVAGSTRNYGTKNVKIMVPLGHLSEVWRTLEMLLIKLLINCEINVILTWSATRFIMMLLLAMNNQDLQ